ncbi:MAG: HINT domain-containing protein [Deltaproteobacteria bacterium]|nr:HINT domain-containing protein [Kofleriaceae bacterium]
MSHSDQLARHTELYSRDGRPTLDVFVARATGDDERLRTTDDHPFWTQRGWVTVDFLVPGDEILFGSSEWGTVNQISPTGLQETVYNIEVDEFHSYYVGNFATLVHNGPCKVSLKVGTTKHIKLNKADNGSYTTKHQSGKKYHGKGSTDRARRSARRVSRENKDPVTDIDHTPADTDADAFAQEAQRLNADGGPQNPSNYNKINSPGSRPQ